MSNDPKFKATEKGVYLDGKEMADGLKAQRTLNKNSNTTMRRIRKIRPDNNPRVKTNAGSRIVRERKPQQIVKKRIPATVIPSNRRVTISRGVNNKPSIYAHVKPIWLDETVFIIGGGPSLKGFNWSLLAGKKTIAINRAIQFYPKADALYFTDGRVYSWYKKGNFTWNFYSLLAKFKLGNLDNKKCLRKAPIFNTAKHDYARRQQTS